MSSESNISAVRRLFDEVYTEGNVDLCDQLMATDLVMHDSSLADNLEGVAAFKERESGYQSAFPKKRATIEDIIAADDKVVARWRSTPAICRIFPRRENRST